MENKNRLVGLETEEAKITFDEGHSSGLKWYWLVPTVVLSLAAILTAGYWLWWKKQHSKDRDRLADIKTIETRENKKVIPSQLPDDTKLNEAIRLYKNGYTKPAIAAFDKIVTSTAAPEVKVASLIYLGIIYDEQGKFSLAVDYYRRALKLDPKNCHAHYNLAISLRNKSLFKEAMAESQLAAKLCPGLIDAKLLTGEIQYESGDYQGAEKTLDLAANQSSDPRAFYDLGLNFKVQGKMAEAKTAFLNALNKAEAGEVAYKSANQLGIINAQQGDLANAKFYLEKAVNLSPKNPKYYYNLALVQFRLDEKSAALKSLDEAIQHGHHHPQAYMHISQLYREMGAADKAEAALRSALEQAPLNPTILSALADTLTEQAKWNDAIKILSRMLDNATGDKERALAHYNLGIIYKNLKDYEKAELHLDKSFDLENGQNEDALVALAETYQQNNQPQRAIKIYRRAVNINPENLPLQRSLSQLYYDLGLLTEAEKGARRLADFKKKEEYYYFGQKMLGMIYKKRKLYDTSIRYLQEALKEKKPESRYHTLVELADTYLVSNKSSANALSYLQRAIAIKPASTHARLVLARALLKDGSISSQERAEEELTTVIENPHGETANQSNAYTLRGIIYYKQGRFSRALDDFNRALEVDPSNRQAFENKRAAAARIEES